ncbi:MAG: hypothetical protein K8T10_22185 [Candidatus Eremiobacteraeota bacterium]|nr:hypothetical protein [Candidatus Eremiobacteraeota bacterium]
MRLSDMSRAKSIANELTRQQETMDTIRKEIVSGQRSLSVADDPAGYTTALQYKEIITLNEGYERNIESYNNELELYENQLDHFSNTLLKLKTMVTEASNDTSYRGSVESFRTRANNLLESLLGGANVIVNGNYMFSGSKIHDKPFTAERLNGEISQVTYNGDNMPKVFNPYTSETMRVNLSGQEIFCGRAGMDENVFQNIIDFRNDLGDSKLENADEHLEKIDNSLNSMIGKRGEIGTHIQHLENLKNFLENHRLTFEQKTSDLENIDMAEAVSRFLAQENVYKASLEVASRLYSLSFLDYIK